MRKRVLLVAGVMGLSVMGTGCKASKQEITESTYYQKLQDQNDKLKEQLKDSKKDVKDLNDKIKEIHEYTGDQKLASYKRNVKESNISKVDMVRISSTQTYKGFAVTNEPVCKYVKSMVADSYRIIGLTVADLEKEFKNDAYSYALIDEDNTTYEFKVYGESYIVYDKIPENVYCFDGASRIGDGLVDANISKKYTNWVDKISDAALIVSDDKLFFEDTVVRASRYFRAIQKKEIKEETYNTNGWKEYRFYTRGSVTKVLFQSQNIIAIEDSNGKIKYYQITASDLKKLSKLLG